MAIDRPAAPPIPDYDGDVAGNFIALTTYLVGRIDSVVAAAVERLEEGRKEDWRRHLRLHRTQADSCVLRHKPLDDFLEERTKAKVEAQVRAEITKAWRDRAILVVKTAWQVRGLLLSAVIATLVAIGLLDAAFHVELP